MAQVPSFQDIESVDVAIDTRHSVRGFVPSPVPREVVEDSLLTFERAPVAGFAHCLS